MTKIIPETINHMFECTAGRRPAVYGQRGEVFINLILGDLIGKAFKTQADYGNAAKIVAQGTFTLSFELNLLKKRFTNFIKAFNGESGLFNDGG
jgi:hypothetical protein